MKKLTWKSLGWLMMCLCALSFTACGDDDSDSGKSGGGDSPTDAMSKIAGTWEIISSDNARYAPVGATFVFNSNGTGSWSYGSKSANFTYTYTSDGKFTKTETGGISSTGTVVLSGDVAVLTCTNVGSSDSYTFTLKKKSGSTPDEDDPDTGTGTFKGAKAVFGSYLVKEFSEVNEYGYKDAATFTYDSKGFVTEIKLTDEGKYNGKVTFTYGSTLYATSYDADGNPEGRFPVELGPNGFMKKWVLYDDKGKEEYVLLTYNSDNQIKKIEWGEEGGIEVTYTLTYEDGDIVRVTEEEDGEKESWDIFYSTDTQKAIENVAGVMEFDHSLGLDVDDLSVLYYLGAMGKGTKHLPLVYTKGKKKVTNTWKLDSSGRAIQLTYTKSYSGEGTTSTRNFYWKW